MPKTTNPLTRKSGVSTNIILTVVVVVAAVLVIGGVLVFSGKGQGNGGAGAPAELLRKPDSHVLVQAPDNRVTVVEFLDYQCPACAGYYKNITKQVEQEYAGRVTFVTRNFPLDMHKLAVPAAQAAEAAALQGKYKEMYHALYDNWESWAGTPDGSSLSEDEAKARAQFTQYAQQIGLDVPRFQQDMTSPQVQQRIDRDRADGNQLAVNSTPTIFINGKKFESSAQTFQEASQQFRQQLDGALGQ